jgi:hypothetical protein
MPTLDVESWAKQGPNSPSRYHLRPGLGRLRLERGSITAAAPENAFQSGLPCAAGPGAPSARPRLPGPSASPPPPPTRAAVETAPLCRRSMLTGRTNLLGTRVHVRVRSAFAALGCVGRRFRPSYNVSPGAYLPVGAVRARPGCGDGGWGADGEGPVIQCMKWGLVPSFTSKTEKPDHFRMVCGLAAISSIFVASVLVLTPEHYFIKASSHR